MRILTLLAVSAALCGCADRSGIPSASDAARAQSAPAANTQPGAPVASDQPLPAAPAGAAQFTYIRTGDIRARPQLLSGWHAIEDGAFRWMERQAQAVLSTAGEKPGNFEWRLYFPEGHMARAGGPVTATVLIEGVVLAQDTFTTAGPYTIRRPVSALNLPANARVTLRVDRAILSTPTDKRELGAVVQAFGFTK